MTNRGLSSTTGVADTREVELDSVSWDDRGRCTFMVRFNCQHCGHRIIVPDEYAGMKERCPDCSQVNVVPSSSVKEIDEIDNTIGKMLEQDASVSSLHSVELPQQDTMAEGTKKCPYCAETILAVASKCKHCKSDLTLRQSNTNQTATRQCPKCKMIVDKEASVCPHCRSKKPPALWAVVVAALIVLSLLGWMVHSCLPTFSDSPQIQPEKKVYEEGEKCSVGYTSYVVWRSWWATRLSDNEFLDDRPDAMFLFIELTVRNNDKKERIIPPFKLVDENGAEYGTTSKAWAVDGSIGVLESLNPSVQKRGFIVFDVPTNHEYRLNVSGGYWSAEDAFITLDPN